MECLPASATSGTPKSIPPNNEEGQASSGGPSQQTMKSGNPAIITNALHHTTPALTARHVHTPVGPGLDLEQHSSSLLLLSYSLQSWQRSHPNSSTLDGYYRQDWSSSLCIVRLSKDPTPSAEMLVQVRRSGCWR